MKNWRSIEDRQNWNDDDRVKLCKDCGMELNGEPPNDCRCDKDRTEGKEIEGEFVEE